MDTPYSIIGVKYVGFTPAQDAVDTLQELRKAGEVDLKRAVAVSRSADGDLHYYPIRSLTAEKGSMGLGAAGFVLGLLFGRPLRWALLGVGIGFVIGTFATLMRKQEVEATVPYLEMGESLLYMQIRDADWSAFRAQVKPYLDQGMMVVRRLARSHTELEAMLTTPTEQQVPTVDEFPEPPDTGTLVPVFDEMDSPDTEPDDLTAINGIGPVFAARLHKGRIRTYAQLAAMDAERIAEIAGVPAARVTSADWIGQAKGLAASA